MRRIAAVSLPATGGDREQLVRSAVQRAIAKGADVIVLPEAALPGYAYRCIDASAAAERILRDLADTHGVYIAAGFLDGVGCSLGLAGPGTWTTYRKRYPSPAESRVWRAGSSPGIVETPVGRIGLAICADVLQLRIWREFRAENVDAVLIAGAWPAYTTRPPPGLGWLWRGSNPYRDELLGRASTALGAPVAFANASGEGPPRVGSLSGGASAWMDGRRSTDPELVTVDAARSPPGPPLRHDWPWAAFAPVYARLASATRTSSAL